MDQLYSLVVSKVIVEQFNGIKSKYITMRSFWEHSVLFRLCCKMLAEGLEEEDAERFFVARLLYDVGQLILRTTVPDKFEEAINLILLKIVTCIRRNAR